MQPGRSAGKMSAAASEDLVALKEHAKDVSQTKLDHLREVIKASGLTEGQKATSMARVDARVVALQAMLNAALAERDAFKAASRAAEHVEVSGTDDAERVPRGDAGGAPESSRKAAPKAGRVVSKPHEVASEIDNLMYKVVAGTDALPVAIAPHALKSDTCLCLLSIWAVVGLSAFVLCHFATHSR